MADIVAVLMQWGLGGLVVASFTEAIFSPVLPDLLLIPLALAAPEKAIYYGVVTTLASVLGGLVGYLAGNRYGLPLLKRFVPPKYTAAIRGWLERYGAWAVVMAALAPIPYKFVSISAGVFRVNPAVFLAASLVGRAKRFMVEGILIYYYGPVALDFLERYTTVSVVVLAVLCVLLWAVRRLRSPAPAAPSCSNDSSLISVRGD